MEEVFDDNGFIQYIKGDVAKLVKYDVENLSQWKKYVTKARRVILERVHARPIRGSTRPHCHQSPMERKYLRNVVYIEKSIPE